MRIRSTPLAGVEGVTRLSQGEHSISAYLVGELLVDAGLPSWRAGLLEGRRISGHLVTHAHPDHFGTSAAVC